MLRAEAWSAGIPRPTPRLCGAQSSFSNPSTAIGSVGEINTLFGATGMQRAIHSAEPEISRHANSRRGDRIFRSVEYAVTAALESQILTPAQSTRAGHEGGSEGLRPWTFPIL